MKDLHEGDKVGLIMVAGFAATVVSVILLLTLKDIYDTQQDRILFQKTYETVLECRKTASVSFTQQGVKGQPLDVVCGTVPVFVNRVP